MKRWALYGIGAGTASALYLAHTYHPLLLHGAIHAAIFASGLIAAYLAKTLTVKKALYYVAGALPVHLAIHFVVIRDLQLTGVSHLLNFLSLP
jgi:hypothetical protein